MAFLGFFQQNIVSSHLRWNLETNNKKRLQYRTRWWFEIPKINSNWNSLAQQSDLSPFVEPFNLVKSIDSKLIIHILVHFFFFFSSVKGSCDCERARVFNSNPSQPKIKPNTKKEEEVDNWSTCAMLGPVICYQF